MKSKNNLRLGVTNVTTEEPLRTHMDKVGATYYHRRVVPLELRPYFLTATGKPRVEFKTSLKTKDRKEADRKLEVEDIKVTRLFDAARKRLEDGLPPNHQEVRGVGALYDEYIRDYQEWARNANTEDIWRAEAEDDAFLTELRKPIEELTPEQIIIRRNLPQSMFDPPNVIAERESALTREYEEAGRAFSAAVEKSGIEGAIKKPAYPKLMDVFEAYSSATGLAPATVKRWRGVIEHLIRFLGHDDAKRVTFDNLKAWRDKLFQEEIRGGGRRTAKTVRESFVAAVKAAYNHACEEGVVAENPAANLKVRDFSRPVRLRDSDFTQNETEVILKASSMIVTGSKPSRIPYETQLAMRWVPWLCAYTGARVNELTQLRRCDIQSEGDVWVIDITPEAGSVKTNTARRVPLHSHLIEQGFAQLRGDGASIPIFYDPALGRGGGAGNPHYKKVGERLAKWVRGLGVSDPAVQPNHAWRHTFKTLSRRHGLDEAAVDAIMGHAPSSVGRAYGRWTMDALFGELEKLPRFLD